MFYKQVAPNGVLILYGVGFIGGCMCALGRDPELKGKITTARIRSNFVSYKPVI